MSLYRRVRPLIRRVRGLSVRNSTGPLPDFVVVGSAKAGTTSILHNLRRHPDIFMPGREIHFFDNNWDWGVGWYRQRFVRGAGKLCGEKSPGYMAGRVFMERMARVIPDARIVVLLREPVARLLSHVNHKIQIEKLPPAERIDMDYVRAHVLPNSDLRRDLIERGDYADQLEGNVFPLYPRERVFVRATDGWARAGAARDLRAVGEAGERLAGTERNAFTAALLADLHRFLGVEPQPPETLRVVGVRSYAVEVDPEVIAHFAEHYRAPNERLFALLGARIPGWDEPAAERVRQAR